MGADSPDEQTILSVRRVLGAEVIDGGDTVVLRVCYADGRPASTLVPRDSAKAIGEILSKAVAEATARAAGRPKR